MNRAERRRNGIKKGREPVYMLNQSQIQKMKEDAVEDGCRKAFALMLAIPVMVIHDKYPQIMRREGRERKFADLILEMYDSYQLGYFSLDEVRKCLYEETGMILEDTINKRFI